MAITILTLPSRSRDAQQTIALAQANTTPSHICRPLLPVYIFIYQSFKAATENPQILHLKASNKFATP